MMTNRPFRLTPTLIELFKQACYDSGFAWKHPECYYCEEPVGWWGLVDHMYPWETEGNTCGRCEREHEAEHTEEGDGIVEPGEPGDSLGGVDGQEGTGPQPTPD